MRELLVFVHVPKTAGSTLNRIFADWRNGHAHLEGVLPDKKRTAKIVRDADWVSSHLPFPQFMAELRSVTSRPFRLVTLVRDPVAQVASHYNWLIEIHSRGANFYDAHPPHIREISASIRACDNADPGALMAELSRTRGLFLNPQCRVALGADVTDWTPAQIRRALRSYDHVTTEAGLPALVREITGISPPAEIKENASSYHFDKAIFQTPEVQAFLGKENRGDFALFDEVEALQAA